MVWANCRGAGKQWEGGLWMDCRGKGEGRQGGSLQCVSERPSKLGVDSGCVDQRKARVRSWLTRDGLPCVLEPHGRAGVVG